MDNNSLKNTKTLLECAMMIALAMLLSVIKVYQAPAGGSVTLCSMLPIILITHIHGTKFGILTGFTYGLIQLFLGLNNFAYCPDIKSVIICAIFDYLLAFGVLGLEKEVEMILGGKIFGLIFGTASVMIGRLICSIISGVTIWKGWAPEGVSVWKYSIVYNCGYMIPEIILTILAAAIVIPNVEKEK